MFGAGRFFRKIKCQGSRSRPPLCLLASSAFSVVDIEDLSLSDMKLFFPDELAHLLCSKVFSLQLDLEGIASRAGIFPGVAEGYVELLSENFPETQNYTSNEIQYRY